MLDLLARLMEAAEGRCDYADARHVVSQMEAVSVRNGRVDGVTRAAAEGIGVRVRIGGAWGFAAVHGDDGREAERALARAHRGGTRPSPGWPSCPLAPEPPAHGEARFGEGTDPFEVPLEAKLEVLLAADEAMRGDPRVKVAQAHFDAYRNTKAFASTDGAR